MTSTLISLQNVYKTYRIGSSEVHAMQAVSLDIQENEFVAIMGSSGSGKSTMLHILGLLDRPDAGTYLLNNQDVSGLSDDAAAKMRNQTAGFIFQQFHLLPRISAAQNVSLPLIYSGHNHMQDASLARLEQVGLSDRSHHNPNELSGGQQQRVAIARALVNNPKIIFADEPTGNLDSRSTEEIIAMLKQLHGEGKTIIMVTHEPDIAAQAERIITMRDGRIISDKKTSRKHKTISLTKTSPPIEQSDVNNLFNEISENLRQSIQALTANKMRSFLSMLGILIGVSSVIAMLALGRGADISIKKQMSSLGTNILSIHAGASRRGGVSLASGTVSRLTLEDSFAIAELPSIKRASATANGRVQIVYGNQNWNTRLQGVQVDFAAMKSYTPTQGRFISTEDIKRRSTVALLGQTVVEELFGDSDPIGQSIKVNKRRFTVIGILPEKGSSPRGDEDDTIMIPITTSMYRILGDKYVARIEAEVADPHQMDAAETAIVNLLLKRHGVLQKDRETAFSIRNMAEMQEALQNMTKTMTMLLGGIAAISLLVGGIGIMNIMLVSVTERTREIGLRKAIGARRKDVMLQFLIESVVMTICGGALGIVLGIGVALGTSSLTGWTTSVSGTSVIMVTLFSVLVGLVFGMWPAQKAAQLNPIEALRFE